jgi:hypothetical protein
LWENQSYKDERKKCSNTDTEFFIFNVMESGIESVSVKEEIYVRNCLFAPNMETLAYFAGELKVTKTQR